MALLPKAPGVDVTPTNGHTFTMSDEDLDALEQALVRSLVLVRKIRKEAAGASMSPAASAPRFRAGDALPAELVRDQMATAAASAAFGNTRLTVAQAAAEAAVGEHTIRRAYMHGHLRIQRFGLGARSLRITRGDLRAWLEAGGNTVAPHRKAR